LAKPNLIELPGGEQIAILYEDRSVLSIDKPSGWMLAPSSWQRTSRNLQLSLTAAIRAGDFWARSRNLKYLRFVHRLDAETSGVLLLAKSPGAVTTYSALFESRRMEKTYLAVVAGKPQKSEWVCRQKIAPDPAQKGQMKVDPRHGKEAETHFRSLEVKGNTALILARPLTGRTHQIRVHLAASGYPVLGDKLYARILAEARTVARRGDFTPLSTVGGEEQGERGPSINPSIHQSTNPRGPQQAHNSHSSHSSHSSHHAGDLAPATAEPGPVALALRAVGLSYTDPFTHRRVRITAPIDEFLSQYGFEVASATLAKWAFLGAPAPPPAA